MRGGVAVTAPLPPVQARGTGLQLPGSRLDEGEPAGLPGTYLNGFCELRPLPYAEAGYGDPEWARR